MPGTAAKVFFTGNAGWNRCQSDCVGATRSAGSDYSAVLSKAKQRVDRRGSWGSTRNRSAFGVSIGKRIRIV